MPTHTQTDAVLEFTVNSVDYSCQVIGAEFTFPTTADGETIPVAGACDPVSENGDPVNGSISGEVFKDTSATGITRALAAGDGDVVAFTYIENEATTDEFKVTGTLKLRAPAVPFAPKRTGRHQIELPVITATLAAPYSA